MRRSLLAAVAVVLALAWTTTAHATTPTVVTLGFDDGTADHITHVEPLLTLYGFKATFFVNSGRIGATRGPYLSWQDLQTLQAEGHEIGGHTVDHTRLTTSATPQADICDDLAALKAHGLDVTSFAYPFGAWDASLVAILANGCGATGAYTSARTTQGIDAPCTDVCAMPLPFAGAPFRTDALQYRSVGGASATELIAAIRAAHDAGGGWLPLVLHGVCTVGVGGCVDDGYTISPAGLDTVLAWLKDHAVSGCYLVRTTAEVMAARTPFDCPAPPPPPPPASGGGGGGGGAAAAPVTTPVVQSAPSAQTAPVAPPAPPVVSPSVPAPPTVRLLAAPSRLLERGVVRFRPVVSAAAGVARVDYLVDGRVVGRRSSAPYATQWTTTSKRVRRVALSVRVTDGLGRTVQSTAVTVRVRGRA